MKFSLALLVLLFVLPVFGEAHSDQEVERCRAQRNSKARIYIEEMEHCSGVLMRESIKSFNEFVERRGPVVDCQEAKENPKLISECRSVGIQKVKAQARSWDLTIRDQDVYACDVDDSGWVSEYVWFCADTRKGKIQMLTQKSVFQKCF